MLIALGLVIQSRPYLTGYGNIKEIAYGVADVSLPAYKCLNPGSKT